MDGTWQAKVGVGPMKGGGCHNVFISVGVPGGPLRFMRLIRVGILQRGIRATVLKML